MYANIYVNLCQHLTSVFMFWICNMAIGGKMYGNKVRQCMPPYGNISANVWQHICHHMATYMSMYGNVAKLCKKVQECMPIYANYGNVAKRCRNVCQHTKTMGILWQQSMTYNHFEKKHLEVKPLAVSGSVEVWPVIDLSWSVDGAVDDGDDD